MENNNLEFLKKNLKFLGFGTSLNAALEAKVSERQEFFKIGVSADFNARQKKGSLGKDKVNYELNFSRSSKPYHYFLDSVKVTLNDQIQNTFSYGKGNDVTAKEAYNLLRGASVLKKAILTDKFTLSFIDDTGIMGKEMMVSSTEEASKIIAENVKNKINVHGSYDLYSKGYLLRSYEGATGKDFSSMPEGKVYLAYSYFDRSTNQYESSHNLYDNLNVALDAKEAILKNPNPEQVIKSFKIMHESKSHTIFEFDREGNEVSVEAPKRNENIWIKLDFDQKNEDGNYAFKKIYQNYGFNLESELGRFPIKELVNPQEKELLISSLGRGNTQMATLETGQPVMIEADPQFKKFRFYDMDFKKLNVLPSQTQEMGR